MRQVRSPGRSDVALAGFTSRIEAPLRLRKDSEQLRRTILAAFWELHSRRDFSRSIADVARSIGVARSTVYSVRAGCPIIDHFMIEYETARKAPDREWMGKEAGRSNIYRSSSGDRNHAIRGQWRRPSMIGIDKDDDNPDE
jgi:hypothetical protein